MSCNVSVSYKAEIECDECHRDLREGEKLYGKDCYNKLEEENIELLYQIKELREERCKYRLKIEELQKIITNYDIKNN